MRITNRDNYTYHRFLHNIRSKIKSVNCVWFYFHLQCVYTAWGLFENYSFISLDLTNYVHICGFRTIMPFGLSYTVRSESHCVLRLQYTAA